jgi:hypothetical protein
MAVTAQRARRRDVGTAMQEKGRWAGPALAARPATHPKGGGETEASRDIPSSEAGGTPSTLHSIAARDRATLTQR